MLGQSGSRVAQRLMRGRQARRVFCIWLWPWGHSLSRGAMLICAPCGSCPSRASNPRKRRAGNLPASCATGEPDMERLLLASAALLALTGLDAARAADVMPPVIYPAAYPGATPGFTFTGFYVGGTIGGALGSSKYSESPAASRAPAQISPPWERVRRRPEGSSAAPKSGTIGKSATSCWASRPTSAAGTCRPIRG